MEARTADGVTLHLEHVRARSPRGALVCLHAMMADGRYFLRRFAPALADAGIDVFAADFRGHGGSVPPTAKDGWSFDDLVELDLPAIVTAAAQASGRPIGEVGVLGHSLGGLVATAALGTGRIPRPKALILVATGVWLDVDRRRRALIAAFRASATLFGRAPARLLRVGTADEARGDVEQMSGWVRTGRWTSLTGADYLASLRAIDVPTLTCASTRDWMCTPTDAAQIAGRITTARPMRLVGTAYGDAIDPDHFGILTRDELHPLWSWIAAAC
jgi:alpha-beta hydrolase superfamily lysophospholipase